MPGARACQSAVASSAMATLSRPPPPLLVARASRTNWGGMWKVVILKAGRLSGSFFLPFGMLGEGLARRVRSVSGASSCKLRDAPPRTQDDDDEDDETGPADERPSFQKRGRPLIMLAINSQQARLLRLAVLSLGSAAILGLLFLLSNSVAGPVARPPLSWGEEQAGGSSSKWTWKPSISTGDGSSSSDGGRSGVGALSGSTLFEGNVPGDGVEYDEPNGRFRYSSDLPWLEGGGRQRRRILAGSAFGAHEGPSSSLTPWTGEGAARGQARRDALRGDAREGYKVVSSSRGSAD
jgi:hypothetical protein